MDLIINFFAFVFSLGLIVALHELGHFFFAKRAKILCHEYAIGMGPILWSKRKGETLYAIRAIPIGGFVSMAGEQIESSLIEKGQTVGLNFDGELVSEIIFNKAKPADLELVVESFELYDKNQEGLFIEGIVDGVIRFYSVKKDAYYILNGKKKLQITPYNRSFESKSLWQRFLTIFGGPAMNFVLAFFLFLIVASIQGKPLNSNKLGAVIENNPAALSDFQKGDVITEIGGIAISDWTDISEAFQTLNGAELVTIKFLRDNQAMQVDLYPRIDINAMGISNYFVEEMNGNEVYGVKLSNNGAVVGTSYGIAEDKIQMDDVITSITITKKIDKYTGIRGWFNDEKIIVSTNTYNINSWDDLVDAIETEAGGDAVVTITRSGVAEPIEVSLPVWEDSVLASQGVDPSRTTIGISPYTSFDLGYAFTSGFTGIGNSVNQVIAVLGLLFGGSDQISVSSLSGPVGIFNIVGQYAKQGVAAFLYFVAFLSVNIGVMNLLPIPALDGGRLVFLGIEAVTRKPLNRKVENTANNVMFILLLALFVYVTFFDILRLF